MGTKLKNQDAVIDKLRQNKIDGAKLLSLLQSIPSSALNEMGIDQVIQSRIHGKVNGICRKLDKMDEIETMFWIHSMPIAQNEQIAQMFHKKGVNGSMLSKQKNLKKFLKSQLASIGKEEIEELTQRISK